MATCFIKMFDDDTLIITLPDGQQINCKVDSGTRDDVPYWNLQIKLPEIASVRCEKDEVWASRTYDNLPHVLDADFVSILSNLAKQKELIEN